MKGSIGLRALWVLCALYGVSLVIAQHDDRSLEAQHVLEVPVHEQVWPVIHGLEDKCGKPQEEQSGGFLARLDFSLGSDGGTTTSSECEHLLAKLREYAQKENKDSMYHLAETYFHGYYQQPRSLTKAIKLYESLAGHGNATAQYLLGFLHSVGLGCEQDEQASLLYHHFAAEAGNVQSLNTLGYRYLVGIGVEQSCDTAIQYLRSSAVQLLGWLTDGQIGNKIATSEAYPLASEEGGLYGDRFSQMVVSLDNILDYYLLMAQSGNQRAQFELGKAYYETLSSKDRNPRKAYQYLKKAADQYWIAVDQVDEALKNDRDAAEFAGTAAGYLGMMFLRGEGVKQNLKLAESWFRKGVSVGDGRSQNGMGIMKLNGLGMSSSILAAESFFKASASQEFSPAEVNMGKLLLARGDVRTSGHYFDRASQRGNPEAYFYLAEMTREGLGRPANCQLACQLYKLMIDNIEGPHATFAEANHAYHDEDMEGAMLYYLQEAEQGHETGQQNVAYLFDGEYSMFASSRDQDETAVIASEMAFLYFTRSARQYRYDSILKVGDYLLKGRGTAADPKAAYEWYSLASLQTSQGLFNLGWMHENGIGAARDYHLAKRYYDSALEINSRAYLPVTLALYKLKARMILARINGENIGSIQKEEPRFSWRNIFKIMMSQWDAKAPREPIHESDENLLDEQDPEMLDISDEGFVDEVLLAALALFLLFMIWIRHLRSRNNRQNQGRQDRDQQQQQQPPVDMGANFVL